METALSDVPPADRSRLQKIRDYLVEHRLVAAVLVGLIFFGIAALYVEPAFRPINHGRGYADISINPFNFKFRSDFRLRPLTPVAAWLVGFRGPRYIYFTYLLCAFFIGLVYYLDSESKRPWLSLTAAAAVAFNAPVLFQLYFSGYVDITQCILLWLAYECRRSTWSAVWAGLAVLNYPSAFFFVPWFFFLWTDKELDRRQLFVNLFIFVAFVLVYRQWEAYVFRRTTSGLNFHYYTHRGRVMESIYLQEYYGWLGLFMGLKMFWTVPFLAAWVSLRRRRYWDAVDVVLPMTCAAAQLFFVTDTSRHIDLAFPSVIIGLRVLAAAAEEKGLTPLLKPALAWLVVFNFMAPQYYVGQSHIFGFFSVPYNMVRKHKLKINPHRWWIFRSPHRY